MAISNWIKRSEKGCDFNHKDGDGKFDDSIGYWIDKPCFRIWVFKSKAPNDHNRRKEIEQNKHVGDRPTILGTLTSNDRDILLYFDKVDGAQNGCKDCH